MDLRKGHQIKNSSIYWSTTMNLTLRIWTDTIIPVIMMVIDKMNFCEALITMGDVTSNFMAVLRVNGGSSFSDVFQGSQR